MGDMAEWHIEQGMDELDAHNAGMCEMYCPYCAELEKKASKTRKRKAKKETDK